MGRGRCRPKRSLNQFLVPPEIALPPPGIRCISRGLAAGSWESSCPFSRSATLSVDCDRADSMAWRCRCARVAEPLAPRSEVDLPPDCIRFIGCTGTADGGAFAPGGAVEGAGCAHAGTDIASAAKVAALIKRCFMLYPFLSRMRVVNFSNSSCLYFLKVQPMQVSSCLLRLRSHSRQNLGTA